MAIALFACACASVDRSAAPVVLHSSKPADAVADCIYGQWLALDVGYAPAKARRGDGYTVQLLAEGVGPMVIADAVPNGSGTTVHLRSWAFGDWNTRENIGACL